MMTRHDRSDFLLALDALGEMFSDDIGEVKQDLYWELLRERCTLEEWHYACTQAMIRETFHKVPLPAVFLAYVQAYRQAQQEDAQQHAWAQEYQRLSAAPPLSPEDMHSQVRRLLEQLAATLPSLEPAPPSHLVSPPVSRIQAYLTPLPESLAQARKDTLRQQVELLIRETQQPQPGDEG